MIELFLVSVLFGLLSSWQTFYEYALDRFIEIEDPDDWEGREDEWCEAQMEYACNFADDRAGEQDDDDDDWDEWDDDEDCEHPSETQQADGSYTCDKCGTITYDISDTEFAHQQGGNFSSSDFRGW